MPRKLFQDIRVILGSLILFIVIACAIGAGFLAPTEPGFSDITQRLCAPSSEQLLGCDLNGGSVLTAILYGARTSLYVGFAAVASSMLLGILLGLISGFFGGWIDQIIMRTVDLIMAFPGILLAMALATVLGPSVHNIIISITATGWTSTARIVRSLTLGLREREFVTACRAFGGNNARILWRHIFPQTISTLIVHGTFSLSGVILIEASLSFLGLGSQSDTPTWGALLSQGRTVLTDAPHLSIAPGVALMLLILALNSLGDGLRDYFDPKR